jgi:hypothetical protein
VCLVSGTGSAVREVQGVFSVFFEDAATVLLHTALHSTPGRLIATQYVP